MSDIALIATDLDGTLFYDRENITARDRDALHAVHNAGKTVVLATGREFPIIGPALDRLDLWGVVDYIIMAGGAEIYDVKQRSVTTVGALTPDMQSAVYHRYRGFPISIVLPRDNVLYTNRVTAGLRGESALLGTPLEYRADLGQVFTEPCVKLAFHGTEEEVVSILPAMQADRDPHVVLCRSHDHYIDCYAAGVSKGAALGLLCARLGIPIQQTAAIGDNHNDLDLLRAAGRSACPGDGVAEAKQAADYVCCPAHAGAFADFCAWLAVI